MVSRMQQSAGNMAVARMLGGPVTGQNGEAVISRLFVLTGNKSYNTRAEGIKLGKVLYEKYEVADSHPDIKEADFAGAVGDLAEAKERFGKAQVTEAQVKDEALARLTKVPEKAGKTVAWAVETDMARLSQAAYDSLIAIPCTDTNIRAAMENSGSGLWNVIKQLKGKGGLWELKVNGAGKMRCNGVKGAGGKVEFIKAAEKGEGK